MSAKPEIAVVVSTYQRPQHLRRCLLSLAQQQGVDGLYEVVVVDDGSQDDTAEMVARFARDAKFPLRFTTHEHNGYHLSRCRNAGVRNSAAPYLLFTDGDCIFPANHLQQHLAARRPGVVRAGHCLRLDEATSKRVDEAAIRSGTFMAWASDRERRLLQRNYRKALFYHLFGYSEKPRLVGWNMALGREEVERVNGFDEHFRGWGCEDDDLRRRLRAQGVRVATSIGYTHGYHLWHEPHATTPSRWGQGVNVEYYNRPLVLDRCLAGLQRREVDELGVRVLGAAGHSDLARQLAAAFPQRSAPIELELLLWPSEALRFTGDNVRRVAVVVGGHQAPRAIDLAADARICLAEGEGAGDVVRQLRSLLGLADGELAATPASSAA